MAQTVGSTADDLAARRRPQAPEQLAGETIEWLAALPANVRPRSLPIQFTRITNTLGRRWRTPTRCLAYLDDLLIDKRGNRRGFPLGIVLEIAALKNYIETVSNPAPQTVWDEVSARRHA